MTDADRKALSVIDWLVSYPHTRTFTPTELGEHLYPGHKKRQCYARPAGRVIRRLIVQGFVYATRRGEGRWVRGCYGRTSLPSPADLTAHDE